MSSNTHHGDDASQTTADDTSENTAADAGSESPEEAHKAEAAAEDAVVDE